MDVKELIERLRYTMRPMESRNSELVAEAADALEEMGTRLVATENAYQSLEAELAEERRKRQEVQEAYNTSDQMFRQQIVNLQKKFEAARELFIEDLAISDLGWTRSDSSRKFDADIAAKLGEGYKLNGNYLGTPTFDDEEKNV